MLLPILARNNNVVLQPLKVLFEQLQIGNSQIDNIKKICAQVSKNLLQFVNTHLGKVITKIKQILKCAGLESYVFIFIILFANGDNEFLNANLRKEAGEFSWPRLICSFPLVFKFFPGRDIANPHLCSKQILIKNTIKAIPNYDFKNVIKLFSHLVFTLTF